MNAFRATGATMFALGCASGTGALPVQPSSARANVEDVSDAKAKAAGANGADAVATSVVSAESEKAPVREDAKKDDSSGEKRPRMVEGTVLRHCAYGPPNYGETPSTDSKEVFAVLVLDAAVPELCPTGESAPCVRNVQLFHVSTLEDSLVQPSALVGKHARLTVSDYASAVSGHHHSRVVLWYDGVEILGPGREPSLRGIWQRVEGDFLGTSCNGYPR